MSGQDCMTRDSEMWLPGGTRRRRLWFMGSSLLWMGVPIGDMAHSGVSDAQIVLAVVGIAAYAAVFLATAGGPVDHSQVTRMLVRTGIVLAIATVLTLAVVPSFALLFIIAAVGAGMRLPSRVGVPTVGVCAALAVGVSLLAGADDGQTISWGVSSLALGILFVSFGRLIVANGELRAARAELAQLAVAEERLRFARDLHDLLGHSLSVIALKAELAGRMLPDNPERAAAEVAEVQGVARDALAEVRQTVGGYRRPTLAGELAGARLALEAAGIEASLPDPQVSLPEDAEAVLAWTVREGTTNVIRHSDARHASIRIVPGLAAASAEVIDDGRGANGGPPPGGHGLVGLRERAERLG